MAQELGQDNRRYFDAARELEEALIQNKEDNEFARRSERNQIIYIVDTNVIVNYLEESRVSRSGEFSFGDFLKHGVPAQVNDQLAMEYLLCGQLPGQRRPRVYLTPPHWNEILDRASETARRIESIQKVLSPGQIEDLGAIKDLRKRIEKAQAILPDRIIEALKVASTFRRRLIEAFADDPPKLHALDRNDQYWSPAMNRIRGGDIKEWHKAIVKTKRSSRNPQRYGNQNRTFEKREILMASQGHNNQSKNLQSDEISLAIIQALYNENPEACGDDRTVLFLFVTADRGLARAVKERSDELQVQGIPMFVRHPRVYSPVLNFSSMSKLRLTKRAREELELNRVFEEVASTLERLLVFNAPTTTRTGRVRRWQNAKAEIEHSMNCWAEAAKQLAVAQAHFFRADSDVIREVARILESPEALRLTTDALTETIQQIRDRHVRFQSLEALSRLVGTFSRHGRHRAELRRAPIQVIGINLLEPVQKVIPHGSSVSQVATGSVSFYDLLDEIASATDSGLLEKIGQELLEHWEHPASQLLAAYLYLAAEAWPSARDCAARCRNAVDPTALLRREADYCFALACRMMLGTPGVYGDAEKVLEKHNTNFRRDRLPGARLAQLRYLVEYAALLSSASVLQAIDDVDSLQGDELDQDARMLTVKEVKEFFDLAHRLEKEARDTLDDNFSGEVEDRDIKAVINTMKSQLFTNIVGTHIFRHSLARRISDETFSPEDLYNDLRRLEEECSDPRLRITKVYTAVSHAILNRNPKNISLAMGALLDILNDKSLSYSDKREYEHLRDHVRYLRLERSEAA